MIKKQPYFERLLFCLVFRKDTTFRYVKGIILFEKTLYIKHIATKLKNFVPLTTVADSVIMKMQEQRIVF